MPWNPELYNKYAAQRSAPFIDLSAMIDVRPGLRVIDLGCGTGELTRRLADMLLDSDVIGLDNSPEMLNKAQSQARPGLRFEQGSIEDFAYKTGDTFDLIFSHAAIQWVEDHERLIPALLSRMTAGGQLAVQMPSNHNHAVHRYSREIAAESPFAEALNGFVRLSPVLDLEAYGEMLFAAGGEDIVALEKLYPHLAENSDAVVEFTSGTLLIPYMERLTPELQSEFMQRFSDRVRGYFPGSPAFYTFKRTLFAAKKA
jgi:trans-aconitate 2-methyltransferase